jgi:hypothetical protein
MNRVILFSVFLFTSVLSEGQVHFGLKGGLNISDIVINNVIDPDAESDFNFKAGIHSGFFAIADVGTRTGLAAELLYSVKGVRAITNINLHYITLPVLLRYTLGKKFIAEGGPEIGYLVAARSRYGNISNIYDNNIDLGLDLGLQYYITSDLFLVLRFNAGISSVIRNPTEAFQGEKIRYQNRVLQLSLGYTLYKRKI